MSTEDAADELVTSADPLHPANLIPSLCRQFYTLGWVCQTFPSTRTS
jgi:methylthioribulose-1-phosphate dehydratase